MAEESDLLIQFKEKKRFRPPLPYFETSDLIRRVQDLWRGMRETKTFNSIHSPHKEVIKSRV